MSDKWQSLVYSVIAICTTIAFVLLISFAFDAASEGKQLQREKVEACRALPPETAALCIYIN